MRRAVPCYECFTDTVPSQLCAVATAEDFAALAEMRSFLALFDRLPLTHRLGVSKLVLTQHSRSATRPGGKTADAFLVHAIMGFARGLHDSVDPMTFADDRRQYSELIADFLYFTNFGADFEAQFEFFVTARDAFRNLESVKVDLCKAVLALAMRAKAMAPGGQHTRKSRAFAKSCITFILTTIPTVERAWTRLHLFNAAANVALHSGAPSLAHSLLRSLLFDVASLRAMAGQEAPDVFDADDVAVRTLVWLICFCFH